MNKTLNKQGFTIIEVVLVLAIAALIFLMIFVAWPALQRNQKDTARKNDASSVAAAIGSYKSNNSGKIPTTSNFGTFKTNYVDSTAQIDQSLITATGNNSGRPASNDAMVINLGFKCNGAASPRNAAVWIKPESGGGTANVCTEA